MLEEQLPAQGEGWGAVQGAGQGGDGGEAAGHLGAQVPQEGRRLGREGIQF